MKSLKSLFYTIILIVSASPLATAQVAFPLKPSSNNRYLVDNNNKPFPIMGRTAWCVISLPESKYKKFIDNTASYGYNAVEISSITHWPWSNHPPFNGRGDMPFTKRLDDSTWTGSLVYSDSSKQSPDLSKPNEQYWSFVDSFLSYCESKGIVVFFFPAYVGYPGSQEGWMKELVANGAEKSHAYGAWIADRYKDRKNMVWMLLGDQGTFKPEEIVVEEALIRGLKSVAGQQSPHYSAESSSGQNSADQIDFGDEMTLNGTYTWGHVNVPWLGRKAYAHDPVLPAFLLEEPYDEEGPDGNKYNPHSIQPVRRHQWWGWLSTIGGYISGNGYIWPFIDTLWEDHLDTKNTQEMGMLNKFITSVNWWELVPSGLGSMKNLVVEGGGIDTNQNYVAAAATPDGKLLIAYIPPAHNGSITVDMTALSGMSEASWYDPTSGNYTKSTGWRFKNKGSRKFNPPGKNSKGEMDWVLVIKKM